MSIHSYLGRFRRWAKPAAKARKARPHLTLEALEDRLVPSTVNIANGVLTYQAYEGEANDLQISFQTGKKGQITYTFEETNGVAIQQNGGNYTKVTADGSLFTSIQVNLQDQDKKHHDTQENTLEVFSTNQPINVTGGDGDDTVQVFSTNQPINVTGGDGNDTVQVGDDSATGRGMEDVTGQVVFDGGGQNGNGKDLLVFADRNAPVVYSPGFLLPDHLDYFVAGGAVTRSLINPNKQNLGFVMHSGTNVEEMDVNASNQSDTIGVNNTLDGTALVIHADDGDDTVSVGNMDLLAGDLTIAGKQGTDTLTITDTASNNRNYVLNTDTVSQGATTITLDTLEGLTINAPYNQDNSFDVQSTTALMPLTLNGGSGHDTVTMSDTALTGIQTYTFNAGSLERWASIIVFAFPTAYVNYSGVEKMIVNAGPANDTFQMTDTAQPKLVLDGGGGINTIDYSAFTSDVTVNLALGTAHKVSSLSKVSLSNVENATGGDGNDILVGDANANVLQGNGGRDVIIGGQGTDTLAGGADDDLLIGGYTAYDTDETALETISSTWAGTGNTKSRVNTLKNGVPGTSIKLEDNNTVNDDGVRDVLTGDASPSTPDWFWANSAQDTLTDYTSSSDFLK
jgi:Ca2+-binding RTX toxin-like protein